MTTPVIGLSHFYYAKVTADTASDITYGTPVRVRNVTQANINFNSVNETFFCRQWCSYNLCTNGRD